MASPPRTPAPTGKDVDPLHSEALEKFLKLGARCPICGDRNDREYLIDFFSNPGHARSLLRDDLVKLLGEATPADIVSSRNLAVALGIPCCDCFKRVFDEMLLKAFYVIRPNPVQPVHAQEFNSCNKSTSRFGKQHVSNHYLSMLEKGEADGYVHRWRAHDWDFFMLPSPRGAIAVMVELPTTSQHVTSIHKFLLAAWQLVEKAFPDMLDQPPSSTALSEKLRDAINGIAMGTGVATC